MKHDTIKWLEIKKREALEIDPATALIFWDWGYVLGPYGVHDDLPAEARCIGRNYFARRPDGDVWVSFHDLPGEVVKVIYSKPLNLVPDDFLFDE
jgi:hypothetical protein